MDPEISFQRQERIGAPLEAVWAQMNTLERVLAKTPAVNAHETKVTLLGIVECRHIRYVVEAPALGTRCEITIDLLPVGAGETRLGYWASVETDRPVDAELVEMFTHLAQDFIDQFFERLRVSAEAA